MRSGVTSAGSTARGVVFLLVAYLLHLAEEWLGGFSTWTGSVLGSEVSPERFALINGIALVLFVAGALVSRRSERLAWFPVSFATLIGLNGVLHVLATVGLGRYSPGTVTAILLYIPLAIVLLRSAAATISRPVFTLAVLAGVLLHGIVALVAFTV